MARTKCLVVDDHSVVQQGLDLLLATHVLGADPTPDAVVRRLESTATDLGASGRDRYYGWGLLDASAAVGGG